MKNFIVTSALLLLATGCLIGAFLLTDWLFVPHGFSFLKYSFRALLILCSLLLLWKALLRIVESRDSEMSKNIIGIFGVVISVILLLEILFSFVCISCSGTDTLISKNWFNIHWKENSLGYRDLSPAEIDRPEKRNLFIIGDSYVAGHGLKEEKERFSNILQAEVKDSFDVFNLGICGADTRDEYKFLSSYPVKPDVIVVCHANNDIYTVLEKKEIFSILKLDKNFSSQIKRFKNSKGFLSSHSFLFNFIDFVILERRRESYLRMLSKNYPTFDAFLDSKDASGIEICYYKNDSLLNLHFKEIDKFIAYSTVNNVPLLFILFPKLNDEVINFTDRTANRTIAAYLNEKNIGVINLTAALNHITESDRVVSKFDSHPSHKSNIIIAEILKKHLQRLKKQL